MKKFVGPIYSIHTLNSKYKIKTIELIIHIIWSIERFILSKFWCIRIQKKFEIKEDLQERFPIMDSLLFETFNEKLFLISALKEWFSSYHGVFIFWLVKISGRLAHKNHLNRGGTGTLQKVVFGPLWIRYLVLFDILLWVYFVLDNLLLWV